jgi:hypothetical protein
VLGWEGHPVHLVGEQHVFAEGLDDREAALVRLFDVTFDSAVEACEHDLPGAGA